MIKASNKLSDISVPKTARQRLLKNIWDYREMYLMALPAIIFVFVFSYIPMYGIIIAFQDAQLAKGYGASEWMGLYHFKRFFNGIYFERLITNTFSISLWAHIFGMPVALSFALCLHNSTNPRIKKAAQTLTYLPSLLSLVVVITILRIFVNKDGGLINIMLHQWGIPAIDFMGEPDAVIPMYVISGVWQSTGSGCIIYLGALAGVDEEMTEAARIDGASKLRIIFSIQLPSILPTLVTMLILNIGSMMSVGSDKLLLLQTPLNITKSEVISTYVYQAGVVEAQYGFSAAVGLFNTLINVTLVAIANFVADKVTGYGLV